MVYVHGGKTKAAPVLQPSLRPLLSPCSAALAPRHGAGSRKAAQNRTMPLYGNNRMQRHFLLSARSECASTAPPSGTTAELQAIKSTGSEGAQCHGRRSREGSGCETLFGIKRFFFSLTVQPWMMKSPHSLLTTDPECAKPDSPVTTPPVLSSPPSSVAPDIR